MHERRKPGILQRIVFYGILTNVKIGTVTATPIGKQVANPVSGAFMNFLQEKFASVFAEYDVVTQARPDGAVLLTLRDEDGKQIRRSISYAQLNTPEQLSWVISAIRRDLAGQASELPAINLLQSQNRFALPTYHSA
jgi:hypothetical protein